MCFVVVVIGGIDSARGALITALLVGLVDTFGKVLLPQAAGILVYVTGWSPEQISCQGLGGCYQRTNIFLPFTVWENVRLASQLRQRHAMRWLHSATDFIAINACTASAIERFSLKSKHHSIAGAMSHGEQRQLEIAMTLATNPQGMLLGEPLAGMGKSTLLKTIMGLVKPRIGSIQIAGQEMTGCSSYEIARLGMACVPESRGVSSNLNVVENLKMVERPGIQGQRD